MSWTSAAVLWLLADIGPSSVIGGRTARSGSWEAGRDATADRTRHNGNKTMATVSDS